MKVAGLEDQPFERELGKDITSAGRRQSNATGVAIIRAEKAENHQCGLRFELQFRSERVTKGRASTVQALRCSRL